MKLREIIAEHLYLIDTEYKPEVLFSKQDSNTRDDYHKLASREIPHILAGYLSSKGNLHKIIHGAVKGFITSHNELTSSNMGSLTRRIVQAIKNEERNITNSHK